jgi:hypothetical protein
MLSTYNLDSTEIKNLFIHYENYPLFSIVSLLTALIYLFASIYFFMANKIKTLLFGLFCVYMFWRSIAFFAVVVNTNIPGLSEKGENLYTYYNIEVISIITILFALYLIKILFVG